MSLWKNKGKISIYSIAAALTIVASIIGIITGVLSILERTGYIDWNYFEKYISPIWNKIESNLWLFWNITISLISVVILTVAVNNFTKVANKFSKIRKWLRNIFAINELKEEIQEIRRKYSEDFDTHYKLICEELDKAKNHNEKMKKELEERQELFNAELEKHKEIEKNLGDDGKKNQEKFNTSFRFLSRIYRKTAEERLEEGDFHEFFYYMHIFYKCLIEISLLNDYDLKRLNNTRDLLLKKETKETNIKLKNKGNICWFILHLLRFIKQYVHDEKYLTPASLIYKNIFNFNFTCDDIKLTYDDIKNGLKNRMIKDGCKNTEIQEILKLADFYYYDPSP
jgi:hypothetical protein